MIKVCLTIDLEQDCPPYLSTYRGIKEGLFPLLELLKEEKILATFFTTGDIASRFPDRIQDIVAQGHELGCHGHTHQTFDQLDFSRAQKEIQEATSILRQFYPVISFRAPNLKFPNCYLSLLEQEGYQLDSSQAKYKWSYFRKNKTQTRLNRLPVSVTSSVLRLPKPIRYAYFKLLCDPIILFVHPWEFADFTGEKLRFDCRFKTGIPALNCLQENIFYFRKKNAQFFRLKDLVTYNS